MLVPLPSLRCRRAPGRAGIAVIRVSGPAAGDLVDALAPPRPKKRFAALRRIRDPQTGETIDDGLVIWFGGAAHRDRRGHGRIPPARRPGHRQSRARRARPPARLPPRRAGRVRPPRLRQRQARPRPGRRSRRPRRRRDRSAAAPGAGGRCAGRCRSSTRAGAADLIRASALVEAAIDFSDEGDVASDAFEVARGIVAELQAAIGAHLDDGHRGEILRDGFRVVLAGPPNAGKSSLLNALARRDAAIVSEEAGTTRDVIEVRLDLEGLPVDRHRHGRYPRGARRRRARGHPPHVGACARRRSRRSG